jgi:hypothetical protein
MINFGNENMNDLKNFEVKDEDELLEQVILWIESDEEWYKGGELVYPKGTRKGK